MNETIPLSEKIYLLGIHPEKGGIISASYSAMDYVLLGTLFLELYASKNITFKAKRIDILKKESKNPLHRYLLEKMGKTNKTLRISRWMNKFYFSRKYIIKKVQEGLVEKRIISMKPRRFLFFHWEIPVIFNKYLLNQLVNDIENQIFKGTSNEMDIMLLSMIKPAGLLKRIFPDKEKRKKAKKQLDHLLVENQVSIAVADAISAANAVAASVAVSAAASSAVTSS